MRLVATSINNSYWLLMILDKSRVRFGMAESRLKDSLFVPRAKQAGLKTDEDRRSLTREDQTQDNHGAFE